ncbi:hypothetical protein RN001_010878 [Aquatica leii]|uniref:LEM domain-containing protein n=1 Tax=Aquatica leii TaxID=1421715 RepID=A0AAN7SER0_9COLE|nr:hypothetical protein RN001_010878 [Aquatica leii]
MADINSLTDAELRTKLVEYGFPIMPITGTTRKVLVKKLKILMENKNDGRRSLGRYSSEEESDNEVTTKNRRVTMPAPSLQTRAGRSSMILKNESKVKVTPPKETVELKHSVKTTPRLLSASPSDEFDTGSDSEPETNKSIKTLPRFNKSFSPIQTNSSPTQYSTYSSSEDPALDRLNEIRSRLSLGFDRPSYVSTPNKENIEVPFLSNFTRRLSQISASNIKKPDYDYKNDIIKEHDTNGAGSYARSNLLGRPTRYTRDVNHDYYTNNIKRNNLIPLILVGVACLFFVVVGIMYYGMRNDTCALDTTGYFIPRCGSMPEAIPGFNCVEDGDIENAIRLMQFIKPELVKRAVSYACNDALIKPFLTETEVINLQNVATGQDIRHVQKQLQDLEVLMYKNPDWGIFMVKTDDGNDLTEEQIITDMKSLEAYKTKKSAGLAVLHPDLPLHCRLYNKINAIFNSLVVLSGIFATLYVGNVAYKYWVNYHRSKKDEVIDMVRRIIDVLESNNQEGDDFLVINHVRDMILPLKNRLQMAKIWDEAVKFINEHESRVRTEVQIVQGEPFEVWRWLGNANLSGSARSKTWQGQAFETQVGSVNSLPCSPTPCLKIRGMMDDNDRNLHSIREAVLSKCAHQCRILHCIVDNTSKCIYLKCADQNDAAIAYRNLHGWWYSGHLVTVKYLRLERYMQRFPDSPVSGPPFLKSITPATDWSS